MNSKKAWPYFSLALGLELINGILSTPLQLLFFAPFFTIVYGISSKKKALIIAAMTGVMIDILSASYPFGFHTLAYTLASLPLYRWRIYFVDKPIGLCSFTFVFSLLITGTQHLLLSCFNIALPLTFRGLLTDFFLLPLADSCYTFICLYLPSIFYTHLKKIWFRFLFFIKTSKRKDSQRGSLKKSFWH